MRDHIKVPFYWETLILNLEDEEIGRLVRAVMEYAFKDIVPTRERLCGSEWAIWPIIKKDLDWQFEHPRAYRYPDDENMRIRNSLEYRNWRDAVFKRDRYTCRVCGQHGGKLNAHHIKHFAQYPELRLEVMNGITLCYDCHHAVHRHEIECPNNKGG